MAITGTGTANFAATVAIMVKQAAEDALRANIVWATPGSYDEYVHVKGTNQFTRVAYGDIAYSSNSTTLTEGTMPTPVAIAISYDSFTATQKGVVANVSDLALTESPHNLAQIVSEKVTRYAADAIDMTMRLAIDAACSTSITIYGGTATSRATVATVANGGALTGLMLKKLAGRLKQANVPTFSNGHYRAVISPRQLIDLQTDTAVASLQDLSKYSNDQAAQDILAGYTGTFAGVDLLVTTNVSTFATAGASAEDVLRGVVFGPQAFGLGDVSATEIHMVPPGGDHSDVLAQSFLAGAKVWIGACVQTAAGNKFIPFETSATPLAAGQV